MRRLIPAIAMLLVSAVMLSTASFAWFTMNEEVTASGMQIQAKADGSLLISTAPFSATNLGTADVEIAAGVKNLKPMAYSNADVTGAQLTQTANGWYAPADNKVTDINTGANTGTFAPVTATAGYSYKEEFYIATAGEALSNATLNVTLTSPVHPATGETHKAYAAAIYVVAKNDTTWLDDADITVVGDTAVAPNAIIFVGEGTTADKRNIVDLTGVTIPSIAAATGDTQVGLKVIVHFYVDGALQALTTTPVITGYTHAKPTNLAWSADNAYYTFAEVTNVQVGTTNVAGKYVPGSTAGTFVPTTDTVAQTGVTYYTRSVPVATDEIKAGNVPDSWYVATTAHTINSNYAYVRSADIPSNGSTLALAFKTTIPAED